MRRWPRHLASFIAGVALSAPLAAQVRVQITEPTGGRPVFGKVTISAEVAAKEPVSRVLFFADGSLIGQVDAPPYRVIADLGGENADHEFRVVAYTASEDRGSATVSTAAIEVNETIDLDLQQLYVTVIAEGNRSLDLDRTDFAIEDEGQPQAIVTFERGQVPITAVLLLDISKSMDGSPLANALRGAQAFVAGMRDLDEAKVMLFSDELWRSVPFTGDRTALQAALRTVNATGGTAVNDFLYLGLKALENRQGRRVVVLFSEGADIHSVLPMEEVVAKARTTQALVYWIRLQGIHTASGLASISTSWRGQAASQREFELLQQAVERSGGRVAILQRADEIEPAFREIIAELREQYVLGYYPSVARNDGSWHNVQVRARPAGVRVRSRGGYIDN